jgi:hypothetical protein
VAPRHPSRPGLSLMDHDAELDASLEQVEMAGLVEQYVG